MLRGSRRASLPGRQGTQRANGHRICGPLPAHIFKGHWQWAVLVQHVVWHHHSEGCGHTEVCHKTNKKRGHDSDRNGPLRILHFFSCGGNITGDVRESGSRVLIINLMYSLPHLLWQCSQSPQRRKNRWLHQRGLQ